MTLLVTKQGVHYFNKWQRERVKLNKDDLSSRQGGDEFALLLMNLNKEEAERKAKEIKNLFFTPLMVAGHELYITTSIGVSMYPTDGDSITTLLKNADYAMYHSKGLGKNHYSLFDEVNK